MHTLEELINTVVSIKSIPKIPQHILEDAKQDLVVDILEGRIYPPSSDLENIAVSLIRRKCQDYWRNNGSVFEDIGDLYPIDEKPYVPNTDRYNTLREIRERCTAYCIDKINHRHADILRYVANGNTIASYGDLNAMSYNATRQLYHRAKAGFKKLFHSVVPSFLVKIVESDKTWQCLLHWIATDPYAADILCTAIPSDSAESGSSKVSLAQLLAFQEPEDHYYL